MLKTTDRERLPPAFRWRELELRLEVLQLGLGRIAQVGQGLIAGHRRAGVAAGGARLAAHQVVADRGQREHEQGREHEGTLDNHPHEEAQRHGHRVVEVVVASSGHHRDACEPLT